MSGGDLRDDHDPALSALYARLPREEPSAALDAAILSAARAAVEDARPRRAMPRWCARLALAATLVLSTSVLLMHESTRAPRTAVPEPSVSELPDMASNASGVARRMDEAVASPPLEAAPRAADAAVDEIVRAEAIAPPALAPAPAAPPTDMRMAKAAPLSTPESIAREVLAGLAFARDPNDPHRWTLPADAAFASTADQLTQRLRGAGFTPDAACPGVRWSGSREGWRAELRVTPEGTELRIDAVDAPCFEDADTPDSERR